MTLVDTLAEINALAAQHNLAMPYLVGGVPRNIFLAQNDPSFKNDTIRDVDITCGNFDVQELAKAFAQKTGGNLIQVDKDHVEVRYRKTLYDFSKNVRYENIDAWLAGININSPTDLQRETFSRDFTVNTLLMTLDFSKVIDLTGRAKKDIENKTLTCPLNCELALRTDPKRILRAYYFKAKYGFEFSSELSDAIRTSIDYVGRINRRYASEMINKIIRNKESIFEQLIADGILSRVPMTKFVQQTLIKHKRILDIL